MLCGNFGNAESFRDGGFDSDYRNVVAGLNYRMSNMQAAVGLAQLERFDDLLAHRLRNVEFYKSRLRGKGKWLFAAYVRNPIEAARHLKEHGIETRPVFTPLHRSPAFRVYAKGKYSNADEVWSNYLVLPTGPHVSLEQAGKITGLIDGFNELYGTTDRNQKCAA